MVEKIAGRSVVRTDAADKVNGRALYLDDIKWDAEVLYGACVRADAAPGRLIGVVPDADYNWSGITVAYPEDIPGQNIIKVYMRYEDMPLLADRQVLYRGEPVLLVAADSPERAQEAAKHFTVEVESMEGVRDLEDIVARFKTGGEGLTEFDAQTIVKGDAAQALASAPVVVEGEYWTGYQEQLYLEPQSMIVFPMEDGGFRVVGSMQCPFYIAHELGVMMDLPHEMIRVEQSVTGGAFGGKEDYPSFLAGYCAVLAKKSGKAVKMVLDRHEDMQYTPKRHPSWLRYRTGLSDDGRILAMDVDFILDGGAYTSVSPVVMYRGILHAALGYRCDHVLVKGHVYQSHTVPNGAFRGFGAPQAFWGLESHVDDLAIAAHMTPDAFRLKNALHLGDSGPTGQIMSQSMGSPAVLEKALAMSDFSTKWAQCSMGKKEADRWYGIGMSFFAHGACFTGDGESRLKSRAEVRAGQLPDGTWGFIIRASSTEMGQGAKTVLAQIAADGLHVPFESIYYPLPDTAQVPNTGPTCASRTTVVAGNTIYEAACDARNQLEELVSREQFEGKPVTLQDDLFHLSDGSTCSMQEVMEALGEEKLASIRGFHQFALPDYLTWDQETFKGDAYPAYSWACNIAEVEVDPLTLEIRLMKLHVCFDVGRLINPVLATGQVHGGLAQSFGYALMEHTGLRDGAYDASRLQTYIIPTMADMPEMNVQFVEEIYEDVEPGAKGMGEIVMNGVPPAVANALYRATGCRLRHLPMTPESLFEQISHPVPSNQEPVTNNQ